MTSNDNSILYYILLGVASLLTIKYLFYTIVLVLTSLTNTIKKNTYTKVKTSSHLDREGSRSQANYKSKQIIRKMSTYESGINNYAAYLIGQIPFYFVRKLGCKLILGMTISKKVVIASRLEVRSGFKISIGENSIIGDSCTLDGRSGLTIGKNVNLSSNVKIWTMQHDLNSPDFSVLGKSKPVVIHDRVWVSSNVIMLPGVEIGEGAVVAAGSVVTKNIEPFSIYAGIPAKKIGERNTNLTYTFDGTTPFFI